ncbi:mediator complex subunit Med5-domain-containing protein [Suillus occidentalis]|nr:mediator complex subunit Med5-domain-containing protein [Suillus occidentalis]
MSLAELTKNSYQCGVSPQQWLGLCKLLVQQQDVGVDFSTAISNAILELYRLYPADPTLREYLQLALSDGLLSNAIFVSTFIRAARDPELQNGSTLDMLCQLALSTHYTGTSGLSHAGSIISSADSQTPVLSKVQDVLALLRIAHSLPPSNFHHLIASTSDLAILLLSCITDMSQVTAAQAMIYLGDANDVLQSLRLLPELRQVLEGFVLSLSLLMGDDAKAVRDAQMLHAMQLTMGKNDVLGANVETDTVTCGLLLQSLVACRTCDFGAGSDLEAVAVMTGTLRWTSWAPNVFCTQLLVAALTCVAQSSAKDDHESSFSLWRAFVVGRLPRLLFALEKSLEAHGTMEADWRAAMHAALLSLSQRSDLMAQCDVVVRQSKGHDSGQDNNTSSLIREFIQQLLAVGIIEYAFAVSMDPMMVNDPRTRLQSEAFDHGCSIETYLDSKLTLDSSPEDTLLLLEKIRQEPGSHHCFAAVVQKRFTSHSTSLDLEHLSHLTRTLYHHDFALDILSLHLKISYLICNALEIISEYDCETVGDPQTAVSHLGDIVLFAEMVLAKFRISSPIIKDGKVYRTELLRCTSRVYQLDDLSPEHKSAFATWYKAIFDSNSEGIDDALLRTTKPQILLQISATLFSQAALARQENRLDNDTLQTGMSYFLGPLLRWTLVGVIHAMLFEIGHRASPSPHNRTKYLMLSPIVPLSSVVYTPVLDISVIRATCFQTLGVNKDPSCKALEDHQISPATRWMDFPKQEIHDALALARRHKAPRIDSSAVASSLGEMETCRRLATFVLAMPRQLSSAPPLLPIFMYNVLPYLITAIDQQQATEKGMNTQLLVTIISSALTAALHIEWAVQTVCQEQRFVLGQPSAAVARRLAADLRAQKHRSSTSATILQRLGSSPAFVTNFPVFVM